MIDFGLWLYGKHTLTLKKLHFGTLISFQTPLIATGTLRTTPVRSVITDTDFFAQQYHRSILSLKYYYNVIVLPRHINAYHTYTSYR